MRIGEFLPIKCLCDVPVGIGMNSDHPVPFIKEAGPFNKLTADSTNAILISIARLKEENEALRRLVVRLTSELELAQEWAGAKAQQSLQ